MTEDRRRKKTGDAGYVPAIRSRLNPKSPIRNRSGYKTIMGTTPKISSHSPFAAEAVYGVKLLLF